MSNRIEELRQRLMSEGLDGYWVVAGPNVRYLSGFTGEDSTLLVGTERSFLVTDSRYLEQAQEDAKVQEIVCRNGPMAATVASLCHQVGIEKLGVTPTRIAHADWISLTAEAPSVQVRALRPGIPERMRASKSPGEVEAIRVALRIGEEAFMSCLDRIVPGRSERWLAATLEYEMRLRGADGAAFETICAVDARASLPHAVAGQAQVRRGGSVLIDWGARAGGYNSDLTRVVGVGKMPPKVGDLAQIIVHAQEAALGRIKPGMPCKEVDRAARAVIARAGYGRYFGHACGHGVGLEVHEAPRLAADEEDVLLPGMILTVEPGIYLPGVGGVRIEEMVLVTRRGCEVLSSLPKTLCITGDS